MNSLQQPLKKKKKWQPDEIIKLIRKSEYLTTKVKEVYLFACLMVLRLRQHERRHRHEAMHLWRWRWTWGNCEIHWLIQIHYWSLHHTFHVQRGTLNKDVYRRDKTAISLRGGEGVGGDVEESMSNKFEVSRSN